MSLVWVPPNSGSLQRLDVGGVETRRIENIFDADSDLLRRLEFTRFLVSPLVQFKVIQTNVHRFVLLPVEIYVNYITTEKVPCDAFSTGILDDR